MDAQKIFNMSVTGVYQAYLKKVERKGDLSGNDYRVSHLRYWSKQGLEITDDTQIVLLYFESIEDLIQLP